MGSVSLCADLTGHARSAPRLHLTRHRYQQFVSRIQRIICLPQTSPINVCDQGRLLRLPTNGSQNPCDSLFLRARPRFLDTDVGEEARETRFFGRGVVESIYTPAESRPPCSNELRTRRQLRNIRVQWEARALSNPETASEIWHGIAARCKEETRGETQAQTPWASEKGAKEKEGRGGA